MSMTLGLAIGKDRTGAGFSSSLTLLLDLGLVFGMGGLVALTSSLPDDNDLFLSWIEVKESVVASGLKKNIMCSSLNDYFLIDLKLCMRNLNWTKLKICRFSPKKKWLCEECFTSKKQFLYLRAHKTLTIKVLRRLADNGLKLVYYKGKHAYYCCQRLFLFVLPVAQRCWQATAHPFRISSVLLNIQLHFLDFDFFILFEFTKGCWIVRDCRRSGNGID